MVTMSSEYSIYLYRDKVDLRKGMSSLSGIMRAEVRKSWILMLDETRVLVGRTDEETRERHYI